MGIELRWWTDQPVLEYRCQGDVEGKELVARNTEALAHPDFPELRCQLCDMDAVDSFDISREEIRRIVELDLRAAKLAPDCAEVAIVAAEDLIFGFARMYQMMLDGRVPGWEVAVFRTRPEAVAWLEVEDPMADGEG